MIFFLKNILNTYFTCLFYFAQMHKINILPLLDILGWSLQELQNLSSKVQINCSRSAIRCHFHGLQFNSFQIFPCLQNKCAYWGYTYPLNIKWDSLNTGSSCRVFCKRFTSGNLKHQAKLFIAFNRAVVKEQSKHITVLGQHIMGYIPVGIPGNHPYLPGLRTLTLLSLSVA